MSIGRVQIVLNEEFPAELRDDPEVQEWLRIVEHGVQQAIDGAMHDLVVFGTSILPPAGQEETLRILNILAPFCLCDDSDCARLATHHTSWGTNDMYHYCDEHYRELEAMR